MRNDVRETGHRRKKGENVEIALRGRMDEGREREWVCD